MISGVSNNTASNNTQDTDTTSKSSIDPGGLADQQVFLNLLVEQIKNQDPLNPMDGMQFVSQLAQFSQLEQTLAMRNDLDKLAEFATSAQTTAQV